MSEHSDLCEGRECRHSIVQYYQAARKQELDQRRAQDLKEFEEWFQLHPLADMQECWLAARGREEQP